MIKTATITHSEVMAGVGTKAKRGDLMVYPVISSATYVHGPTERTTEYALGWVTGITREGKVRTYNRPGESWEQTGVPSQVLLVSQSTLDVNGVQKALSARKSLGLDIDFPSLAAVKEFVRKFLK